jgi:hypothetical protein
MGKEERGRKINGIPFRFFEVEKRTLRSEMNFMCV